MKAVERFDPARGGRLSTYGESTTPRLRLIPLALRRIGATQLRA